MKNKNPLKATLRKNDVLLESGCEARIIPLAGISAKKISQVFDELGYVDEPKNNPIIFSAKHDSLGQLIIRTLRPEREVTIKEPWIDTQIKKGLSEIGASADDYESFCQTLEKHGLPRPANEGLISGSEREELTLPNLNEFDHPIEKSEIDPSLFADEKLTVPSLFEFEIDINKPLFSLPEGLDLSDLFEFNPEKKPDKKNK